MVQKCDIEIAQETEMNNIAEIAAGLGIDSGYIEQYGRFKAKIDLGIMDSLKDKPDGKLILVTAISPTPAGEGKTTNTIGIGDALSRLGKKTIITLREPSLGPVFGMKGGAAGGGYSQVVPMEDINLHFTGDIHAVGTANNLLAAMIDNHIYQCNSLSIDARKITWKRCMDMNDRQLRSIVSGLGGKFNGVPREDGFDITVASEVMAILCLSSDIDDLKRRLDEIVIGYTFDDVPVRAKQLKASGAMAVVLKDALKPNLVQTLEHTPALIHGGPFANIAHGSNSVIATKIALKLADYVVTEAGFGADLGAEKFIDITCRSSGFMPDAAVIVATVRALKHHGGGDCEGSLKKGMCNLERHIKNLTCVFNLRTVVAINRFPADSPGDIEAIMEFCEKLGVKAFVSDVWASGGKGGLEIAYELIKMSAGSDQAKFLYETDLPLKQKIEKIVKDIYHGTGVEYSAGCEKEIKKLEEAGFGNLPVCVAKTQYSFTDDPKQLGAPVDFKINVNKVKVSAGAGFVVAITGEIMTMPGLPKMPAAEKMDVDSSGRISGLF